MHITMMQSSVTPCNHDSRPNEPKSIPKTTCVTLSEPVFRAELLFRKQVLRLSGSFDRTSLPHSIRIWKAPSGSSETRTAKHTANCCSGTDSNLTVKRKRGMYCCSSQWIFALVCGVVGTGTGVPTLVIFKARRWPKERGYRQE